MENLKIKKNINLHKTFSILITVLLLVLNIACEDFIEIDLPNNEVTDEFVFNNDASAESALIGIYGDMIGLGSGFSDGWRQSVTFLSGLAADELTYINTREGLIEINENDVVPTNTDARNGFWVVPYEIIYRTNALLTGINNSTDLSDELTIQIEGEAKFLRAFSYFYLVNLFGDVPLILTTDIESTQFASRNSEGEIYAQIVKDLVEAKNLLADDYPTTSRVRPNKFVVSAFLARVYLFLEDWNNAENEASFVLSNSQYELEEDLNDVFLSTSSEAIWQLLPNTQGLNTNEGYLFIVNSFPPSPIGGAVLDENLANAFDTIDTRRINWIGTVTDGIDTAYYPNKYKIRFGSTVTEYSMVFRLSEQYLIRAEAKARLGNISGAQSDLNMIRNRASLPDTDATDEASLVLAIEQERRFELFIEWGHRWFDLKRYGRSDQILGAVKPLWNSTDVLFPIPSVDIQNNPNLTQNPGY